MSVQFSHEASEAKSSKMADAASNFRFEIEAPNSKNARTRVHSRIGNPTRTEASYANQPINQWNPTYLGLPDSLPKWQLPIGACADYDDGDGVTFANERSLVGFK